MEITNLRLDGRRHDQLRKPIIKYDVLNTNSSLQYQVGENLLIVKLLPSNSKRVKVFINQIPLARINMVQIKDATLIIQSILSKILKQESQKMIINIDVLSCDRTIKAHIYNSVITLLCLVGYEFINFPIAITALCKQNNVMLDDDQMNFLVITDGISCFYTNVIDLHPQQVSVAMQLAIQAQRQFINYIYMLSLGKDAQI